MHTAAMGRTQKHDGEGGIDQQDIFHRLVFFLAAIPLRLFKRVLGADDMSFGAVMSKRGAAGASSSEATTVAASASATLSRCAKAVRERAGASPRARSATSSAGKRT